MNPAGGSHRLRRLIAIEAGYREAFPPRAWGAVAPVLRLDERSRSPAGGPARPPQCGDFGTALALTALNAPSWLSILVTLPATGCLWTNTRFGYRNGVRHAAR